MTSDRGGKEKIFVRTSRLEAVLQNREGLCAWFNALADLAKARAISAASDPGPRVHPEVIAVMGEARFDLSGAPTTKLTAERAAGPWMLSTMGCGEQCPVVPSVRRDDWPLDDPKGKPIEAVRAIRDEIRTAYALSRNRAGRDTDRHS